MEIVQLKPINAGIAEKHGSFQDLSIIQKSCIMENNDEEYVKLMLVPRKRPTLALIMNNETEKNKRTKTTFVVQNKGRTT